MCSKSDKTVQYRVDNMAKQGLDVIATEQYRKWQLSSVHMFIQRLQLEWLLKTVVTHYQNLW